MAEPVYKLEQLNFNGPLDLLLHLIEKNKVDIYDIPIAEITRQYIDYIENIKSADLEVVSAFLVMAATLLDIKARMLLSPAAGEDESEEDPREELVRRLLEYRRAKFIAEELKAREREAKKSFFRNAPLPEELAGYAPPVNLDSLLSEVTLEKLEKIYAGLKVRMEGTVNTGAGSFGTIERERVSIVRCIEKLVSFTKGRRRFTFRQMVGKDTGKTEVVVSFLAVLELMRLGKITATQEQPFEEINVEICEGANLEEIDLSSIMEE